MKMILLRNSHTVILKRWRGVNIKKFKNSTITGVNIKKFKNSTITLITVMK